MTAFPRVHLPFQVSELEVPGPLMSKAQSGKIHTRSNMQVGWRWSESYLLKVTDTADKLFMAQVRNYWRNGTIFTITHRDYLTIKGTGGGSPIVNGSDNLIVEPEDFSTWTVEGTPVLTSGQTGPFGETNAYLVNDNDGAAAEGIRTSPTFSGNGTKTISVFMKAGTATQTNVRINDATAVVIRAQLLVNWSGGVPTPTIQSGSGVAYTAEDYDNGWYRLSFTADSIVAANDTQVIIYPAGTTSANTGTVYLFGANAWNEVSPARYSGPDGFTNEVVGPILHINGATASTANWLRGGDLFSVPVGDITYVLQAGADVTTQANGYAAIKINPPLFTGGAPADNAALTLSGVTHRCVILEPPVFPTTSGSGADFGEMSVTFGEAL